MKGINIILGLIIAILTFIYITVLGGLFNTSFNIHIKDYILEFFPEIEQEVIAGKKYKEENKIEPIPEYLNKVESNIRKKELEDMLKAILDKDFNKCKSLKEDRLVYHCEMYKVELLKTIYQTLEEHKSETNKIDMGLIDICNKYTLETQKNTCIFDYLKEKGISEGNLSYCGYSNSIDVNLCITDVTDALKKSETFDIYQKELKKIVDAVYTVDPITKKVVKRKVNNIKDFEGKFFLDKPIYKFK